MSNSDRETIDRTLQRLTPAEKLELIEQVVRSLRSTAMPFSDERQQSEARKLIAEMVALPPEGPDDGFSGRDHDKLLYGSPS